MGGTSYSICMFGVYINSSSIYLDDFGDVMKKSSPTFFLEIGLLCKSGFKNFKKYVVIHFKALYDDFRHWCTNK